MTFTEIVTEIAARLNLTSSEATTRIGRLVNIKYRKITTKCGMKNTRRVTTTQACSNGVQTITVSAVEHIDRIIDDSASEYFILEEVSYDEIRDTKPVSGRPTKWAVKTQGADSVIVIFNTLPADTRTLTIDGETTRADISGATEPVFPESFHDVVVSGVLMDEYKKMHQSELAKEEKAEFEQTMSDLRFYLAKTGYLLIRQGQRPRGRRIDRNRIQ